MANAMNGLYRDELPASGLRYARVRHGSTQETNVPEERYRAEGYLPAFENLPPKEEYEFEMSKGKGVPWLPGLT
jgi:hypothetical protein